MPYGKNFNMHRVMPFQRSLIAAAMLLLWIPVTALGEDSAEMFKENCLRCHTVDKVASTAADGTDAEQRESLRLTFKTHPKKPVEFNKDSMIDYLIKEFAARTKK
jgi:mono/diheme cytochrome c family protein